MEVKYFHNMHKLEPKMVLAYYFLHFTIPETISADIMVDNIDMFKNDVRYRENIAHIETIPAKEASFRKVDNLNERIVDYLDSKNVKLYEHQAETYEAIKDGENVIITTPTASGKTLAFNLPIMETMIEDKDATALYIYPAKALSNDQLHVLEGMEEERRLCYVAITRAKKHLWLVNANKRLLFGTDSYNKPSRFISEINPDKAIIPSSNTPSLILK